MASLRKQFEATIKELKEVLVLNIKEQKDIKSLRDQLFSGTSVKESREAIRQNDNIKLLTLVTIFFLPLTFASLHPHQHTIQTCH
jgi:Mg2+ and Co2+ transporter CorA